MRKQYLPVLFAVFAMTSSAFAATPASSHAALPQLAAQAFPLPVPEYLAQIINDAAKKYSVDPNLIAAMAFRESRFDAHAVSSRGAQGLMQLMPRTARALGVNDSFDPQQNILGGTKYLKSLLDRFHGDIDMTLAAYNAGPELVAKVGPGATQESAAYVVAVKSFYEAALRAL